MMQIRLEKKYAPALVNYGQSCFIRSDFFKMKCVCETQMTIRNYKQVKSSLTLCMMFYVVSKKEMKSNYLSFCEYLTKIPPCHYQIFYENQNPVNMHTSIMCINIVQNIKAVAPKL